MTTSPLARLRRRMARPMDSECCRGQGSEQGAATAEYAVATVAGCGFAAVLIELLSSGFGQALLEAIFNLIMGLINP